MLLVVHQGFDERWQYSVVAILYDSIHLMRVCYLNRDSYGLGQENLEIMCKTARKIMIASCEPFLSFTSPDYQDSSENLAVPW